MVPGMDPEKNCNIESDSTRAKLIREAKILIMDEVTMMSKIDLERIDRTLQDIMNNDNPFGGKIILLSGDFRQILPVERNPVDSVNTCLKRSYLW
jgi:ATP-dependent DNA helicase PIF1